MQSPPPLHPPTPMNLATRSLTHAHAHRPLRTCQWVGASNSDRHYMCGQRRGKHVAHFLHPLQHCSFFHIYFPLCIKSLNCVQALPRRSRCKAVPREQEQDQSHSSRNGPSVPCSHRTSIPVIGRNTQSHQSSCCVAGFSFTAGWLCTQDHISAVLTILRLCGEIWPQELHVKCDWCFTSMTSCPCLDSFKKRLQTRIRKLILEDSAETCITCNNNLNNIYICRI